MSNEQATERPWTANIGQDDDSHTFTIGPKRGDFLVNPVAVTTCGDGSAKDMARNAANAALIVKAVNNHDPLVAAVEGLLAEMWGSRKRDVRKHSHLMIAEATAMKALADAKP